MSHIYIRDVPDDIHAMLKAQADAKDMTQNQYLLCQLSRCAIAGSPSIQQLMPESAQFIVRSILLADEERRQAYTEAQLRLIRDNLVVLKRVEELLDR